MHQSGTCTVKTCNKRRSTVFKTLKYIQNTLYRGFDTAMSSKFSLDLQAPCVRTCSQSTDTSQGVLCLNTAASVCARGPGPPVSHHSQE